MSNLQDLINLLKTGKFHDVIKLSKILIIQDPCHYSALNILGMTHSRLKNFAISETFLTRAIIINPKYVEAYNNLGVTQKNLSAYDDAVLTFHKAINLKTESPNVYNVFKRIIKAELQKRKRRKLTVILSYL